MAYDYEFTAPINKYDYTKYYYTVVYLPKDIAELLDMATHMRLRIEAEIDGVFVKGTLMPDRVGSDQTQHLLTDGYVKGERVWYYQVPRRILKLIKKDVGDSVHVQLRVGDQDEVEMHPAQEDFLQDNPHLLEIWNTLTPGKRRGLSYPILKAKTDQTIEKRLAELEETLLSL